jgi:hypothetical protein
MRHQQDRPSMTRRWCHCFEPTLDSLKELLGRRMGPLMLARNCAPAALLADKRLGGRSDPGGSPWGVNDRIVDRKQAWGKGVGFTWCCWHRGVTSDDLIDCLGATSFTHPGNRDWLFWAALPVEWRCHYDYRHAVVPLRRLRPEICFEPNPQHLGCYPFCSPSLSYRDFPTSPRTPYFNTEASSFDLLT